MKSIITIGDESFCVKTPAEAIAVMEVLNTAIPVKHNPYSANEVYTQKQLSAKVSFSLMPDSDVRLTEKVERTDKVPPQTSTDEAIETIQ